MSALGVAPFEVKDCALIALATGAKAQNLRELRDKIMTIDQGSIYYHFWGARLRPSFDDPEYNNDFAAWAKHALHDSKTAERLAIIDPVDYPNLEDLRQEVIEVIEERLYEMEFVPWCGVDEQFNFITSQIVVFDTGRRLVHPRELAAAVPELSRSSVFYHFIEARRRTPGAKDDFSNWLSGFGDEYSDLISMLAQIDPYFPTLTELRDQLAHLFELYFGG